jgi:hypothetical protein
MLRCWFIFLEPFHHLTDREIEVAASFVSHRFNLSKVIKDDDILDKVVMSEDTKKKIREALNITIPHFQVIMSKLRKASVIIDNKINPRYIPNYREEKDLQLLLLFEINNG